MQGADGGADVQIGAEDEHVEQVGKVQRGVGEVLILELQLAEASAGELLRGKRAERIGIAAEEVETDFLQRDAIDGGELHFEHHLAEFGRGRRLDQVDHFFGIRGGDGFRFFGGGDAGGLAAQHDGFQVAGDLNRAVGHGVDDALLHRVEFHGIGQNIDVDAARRDARFPNNHGGFAKPLGVDHDFAGGDNGHVGDLRLRGSHGLHVVGELQQFTAADGQS